MCSAALPAWVFGRVAEGRRAWCAGFIFGKRRRLSATFNALPVYQRQIFPERVLGEKGGQPVNTVWENEGVRLWTLPQIDAGNRHRQHQVAQPHPGP
jgi:3-hydroxyacyl-CoA dehydrogenase